MLDYIETIQAHGSIAFDTDAPDGDVNHIIALTLSNLGYAIRKAIEENRNELFVIKVTNKREARYGEI